MPASLPLDLSQCLFRVLQEALHNAVRHSQVDFVEVALWGSPGEIHLHVRDSGVGFDPEAASSHAGLGLVSMKERIGLVHGTIEIRSKPQAGTIITCRGPIPRTAPQAEDRVLSPLRKHGVTTLHVSR